MCSTRSFHWVLSAGGQAQLEDGLESPHLLGNNYHIHIHAVLRLHT